MSSKACSSASRSASANGRVLVAIDLDTLIAAHRCSDNNSSTAALDACRPSLRLAADQLPSVSELQALVPHGAGGAAPMAADDGVCARREAMPPPAVEMPDAAPAPAPAQMCAAVSTPCTAALPLSGLSAAARARARTNQRQGAQWDDVPTAPALAELPRPGSHPSHVAALASHALLRHQVPVDEELSTLSRASWLTSPESRPASTRQVRAGAVDAGHARPHASAN